MIVINDRSRPISPGAASNPVSILPHRPEIRDAQRRHARRELDCILGLFPCEPRQPSTFGLEEDELRSHANALIRSGWTVPEVTAVLDVQPRKTGGNPND